MKRTFNIIVLITLLALNFGAAGVTPGVCGGGDDFVITVKTDTRHVRQHAFTIPTTGGGLQLQRGLRQRRQNEATAQTGSYTSIMQRRERTRSASKTTADAGTGFPRMYF